MTGRRDRPKREPKKAPAKASLADQLKALRPERPAPQAKTREQIEHDRALEREVELMMFGPGA